MILAGVVSLQLHPLQRSSVDKKLSEAEVFKGKSKTMKIPGRTAAVLVEVRQQ